MWAPCTTPWSPQEHRSRREPPRTTRPEVPGSEASPTPTAVRRAMGAARRALVGALVGSLLGATATLADLSAASATQAHKGPHAAAVALGAPESSSPPRPTRRGGRPRGLERAHRCRLLRRALAVGPPAHGRLPRSQLVRGGRQPRRSRRSVPFGPQLRARGLRHRRGVSERGRGRSRRRSGRQPQAPSCVERLQGADLVQGTIEGIGEGAQAAGSLAVTLRTVPGLPASAADEEIALPVSYQGVTGTTYSDYIYIDKGRSETVLEWTTSAPPRRPPWSSGSPCRPRPD